MGVKPVSRAQTAHRMLDVARRANSAGRPVAALRAVTRGLTVLDLVEDTATPALDPESATLASRLLITAAWSTAELRGMVAGLATLERAASLLGTSLSPSLETVLVSQRCLMLLRFGEVDRAMAEFATIDHRLPLLEPFDRCTVLINRGVAALNRLDLRRARQDFDDCQVAADGTQMAMFRGMALHNRGYTAFLAGDLVAALRDMETAIATSDELPVGVAQLDRARVLVEAGLVREADAALAEASGVFATARVAQDLGEALVERARCALVAGDAGAARRFAARARDIFRRRGNDRWRRIAELVLLQGDLAAGRPGGRLIAPALRLRAEFAADALTQHARAAALIAAEAAMTTRGGDAGAVLADTPRAGRREPITARLHDRYVRARYDLAEGRSAAAARHARAGLAELVEHQSRFGSIDLQTAAAVHGRRLAELGIEVALRSRRLERVFDAAERGRAASTRLVPVRPPEDETVADLLAELRQVGAELRAAGADHRALGQLHRRRSELEGAIASTGWTRSGTGEARRPARVEDVRAQLSADEVLVMYLDVSGALHALLVAPALRLISLGPSGPVVERVRRLRADLDVPAQTHVPAPLREAVMGAAQSSAGWLDEVLVRPLDVDGRRLVVASTGVLGQLPWGLLPSLRSAPVVVTASATSWITASASPVRDASEVTAVAGPRLPHAAREVAGVAAAWSDATVSAGADGTRAAVAAALPNAAVLHVAAHGTHNTENALFSSLQLADGALFAHELDNHAGVPPHVVLSACELGLATVRPGDEALGLTSVLLRLGTQSVVASVARVGDEITADTMIDYHRLLAAGADSATALAEAVAKADGVAPFTCFGTAWRAADLEPASALT